MSVILVGGKCIDLPVGNELLGDDALSCVVATGFGNLRLRTWISVVRRRVGFIYRIAHWACDA